MEIDPAETVEKMRENDEHASSRRLNNAVAVTIALLSTFMVVCKVKDDNIVQAMQQAQADRLDHWSWYQAHNIRHEVLHSAADMARAEADATRGESSANPAALEGLAKQYDSLAKKQEDDMADVKQKAQGFSDAYDRLNFRDDQFDLMDSALALAISLLAITALTQAAWLYFVALVPTAFGLVMGLAGLLGWGIHPDALATWLGA